MRALAFPQSTVLLCLLLAAGGCDEDAKPKGDGDPDGGPPPDAMIDGDDGLADLTPLDELPVGEWSELLPGGDTRCSDGSPYRFYVWRGTTNQLVVNFSGGGACWSGATCIEDGTVPFTRNLDWIDMPFGLGFKGNSEQAVGMWDMTDVRNPVKDYTQVFVPYCSGDIHLGDNVQSYEYETESFDIYHRGADNTRAVLAWIFENIEAPDTMLSTGCSAGAYGSLMWGAHLMHQYPDAHRVVFADSGTGALTQGFFDDFLPQWKIEGSYPTWIEGFALEGTDALPAAYKMIAAEEPDAVIAQYNNLSDGIQSLFYAAMGGNANAWTGVMAAGLLDIAESAPNFRAYVTRGTNAFDHCVIEKDDFYTEKDDGVNLTAAEWVGELLDDSNTLDDIDNQLCSICTPP